jgi:hypothetical protein
LILKLTPVQKLYGSIEVSSSNSGLIASLILSKTLLPYLYNLRVLLFSGLAGSEITQTLEI